MTDTNAGDTARAIEGTIADLISEDRVPNDDGEPVFQEPWQARAFGLALALTDGDEDYGWDAFQRRLVAAVAAADESEPSDDPEGAYYDQWLRALERLLVDRGTLTHEQIRGRAAEFASGARDASEFVSER